MGFSFLWIQICRLVQRSRYLLRRHHVVWLLEVRSSCILKTRLALVNRLQDNDGPDCPIKLPLPRSVGRAVRPPIEEPAFHGGEEGSSSGVALASSKTCGHIARFSEPPLRQRA